MVDMAVIRNLIMILLLTLNQGLGLPLNHEPKTVDDSDTILHKYENSILMKNGGESSSRNELGSSPSSSKGIPVLKQIRRRDVENQEFGDETNSNSIDREVFYPMLVSKRSAAALNRLINALKTSFDSTSLEQDVQGIPFPTYKSVRNIQAPPISNSDLYNPHLQRRGQQKDRKNYLRCYFNAVSCF